MKTPGLTHLLAHADTPLSPAPEPEVEVLHITHVEADHARLCTVLDHPRWLHRARDCSEARRILRTLAVSIVLAEARLPDGDWKLILDEIAAMPAKPILIVCSALADEKLWAEVLNLGGFDVLTTPFVAGEVVHVLNSARLSRSYGSGAVRKTPAAELGFDAKRAKPSVARVR